MISHLVLGVVLLLAGKDPQIVGTWGLDGEAFATFSANGKGEMEGEPFSWSTDKGILTIVSDGETEQIGYKVDPKNGQLAISMGGVPLVFQKIGKGAKAGASSAGPGMDEALAEAMGGQPAKGGKTAAPAGGKAGNDQLSQLLLSSAWCSFTYNKTTGYSNTTRVQFFPDGTYQVGARGEGYSSGYGGTMASQHDSGSSGRWQSKGGALWMSEGQGELGQIPGFRVTQNSNGSPIINADGKEYMLCK